MKPVKKIPNLELSQEEKSVFSIIQKKGIIELNDLKKKSELSKRFVISVVIVSVVIAVSAGSYIVFASKSSSKLTQPGRKPLLILSIDGLLDEYLDHGLMPNLKRFATQV